MSEWITKEDLEKIKNLRKTGDVERLRKKASSVQTVREDGKRMFKRLPPVKPKKKKEKDIPTNFESIYWLDYKE